MNTKQNFNSSTSPDIDAMQCYDPLIFQGDCLIKLKELPSNSVDAVITDPPYCSGGFSETQKKQATGQGLRSETIQEIGWFTNDNMTTQGLVWLLRSVMVECERIMKDGASALVFTDWRMIVALAPALESTGLQFRNIIVWDKGNPGLGNGFRPQHEIILHYVKGKGNYYSQSVGNVIRSKRMHSTARLHQTQKPVELLAKLIEVVSKKGDTILDPFFGSGSTGEAAIKLGRSIIGIEKSEVYHDIATERIEETVKTEQGSLFNGA
jgi:site-specific DNA-methyltransferase (adenine-specific)